MHFPERTMSLPKLPSITSPSPPASLAPLHLGAQISSSCGLWSGSEAPPVSCFAMGYSCADVAFSEVLLSVFTACGLTRDVCPCDTLTSTAPPSPVGEAEKGPQ